MHKRQRRGGAALALLGMGTVWGVLAAGCGSSSSNGSSTAHIRGVNVATATATVATDDVLVNGAALGGDLAFGEVSSYNFIGGGDSTFSFTTTAALATGITSPPSPILTLNTGSSYTAYLIGRTDVQGKADPRFLQTVVTGDRGAAAAYAATPYAGPPAGQANVRILNGAADAGAVDVLVNGAVAFAAVAYPTFPTVSTAGTVATTTGVATTPVTAYQGVPSGTISVQVNKAGTATVVVPATNVGVSGGGAYTLVVTEPTNAPTYSLKLVSD